MQMNNVTSLREMLEQLTTEQLDEMLQKELHKEQIDEHSVRLIIRILREREADHPVDVTPEIEQAWEKYQSSVALIERDNARTHRTRSWFLRAASVAAVLCLIVLIFPQQVGAETFWERLSHWTENIVEFFGPKDDEARIVEYEFKTDNLGLQQVYDAVVKTGVTEPVVPMWLPDGYELVECVETLTPKKHGVYARFAFDDSEIVFQANNYTETVSRTFYKDETLHDTFEREGATFHVMKNNDKSIIVWAKNNLECAISIDCQEETLYRIIESIYIMEA